MKPVVLGCVGGLLLALCGSQVAAQPLAEIARREKLRREALAEKAKTDNTAPKVYTNADLRGGGRLTTSSVEAPSPTTHATRDNNPVNTGCPFNRRYNLSACTDLHSNTPNGALTTSRWAVS